jgi:hypothetical protein
MSIPAPTTDRPTGLPRRAVLAGTGAMGGLAAAAALARPDAAQADPTPQVLDRIVFGNTKSESAHALESELSSGQAAADGALGQTARIFHPSDPQTYWGGGATFTRQGAKKGTTYVSVKLWGGDFDPTDGNEWRLHLYAHVDGEVQQIGYQEQGVIDSLDCLHWQPRSPGRFFLHTLPLPESLTKGRREITFEIRATGRLYSYGGTPESYFYPLTEDSRPVYALYTHDSPSPTLDADDEFGTASSAHARDAAETDEAIEKVRARVSTDLTNLLAGADPAKLDGWQIQELVESYLWEDPDGANPGYGSSETFERIFAAIDGRYQAWQADDAELTASSQQWQGFGRYALALYLLGEDHRQDVEDALDQPLTAADAEADEDTPLRRQAYGDMFAEHMLYWRTHFPHYTNQIQICGIGLYQVSRALQQYFPDRIEETGLTAETIEKAVRGHLEEGLGLRPWLGRFEEDLETRRSYLGTSYHQVTQAGLTRELGYVGNYGEVHDWLAMMWEAIVRGEGAPEDGDPWVEQVTEHIRRLSRTRLNFRVVEEDDNGARVVQEETVTGWRNEVFPGKICYLQPTSWDGNPLQVVATYGTGDEVLESAVQQLMADGQLGRSLDILHTNTSGRVGLNAFRLVFHHLPSWTEGAGAEEASGTGAGAELPTDGNDVFADPENGIVALCHGKDTLWASTYYRARQAMNSYGRVHLIRDGLHRSATVRTVADSRPFALPEGYDGPLDAEFGDGEFTLDGDLLNFDYAINDESAPSIPGLFDLPEDPLGRRIDGNGLGGTVLQRARLAADVLDPTLGLSDRPAIESVLVGRPEIATLQYGEYIVVVNSTSSTEGDPEGAKAYTVTLPRTGMLEVLYAGGPTGSDVQTTNFVSSLRKGCSLRPGANRKVTVPPLSVLVLRERGRHPHP